jgi:hypothetical protein
VVRMQEGEAGYLYWMRRARTRRRRGVFGQRRVMLSLV